MSLAKYNSKRDFSITSEPSGKPSASSSPTRQFVIQKHDASRLHYDFRLEFDGVLKSWAVPKGPHLDPAKKSLAVQVEDHPIDYGDFEGVIPDGQYGGGTVLLWDTGTWQPLSDPAEGFRAGKLHFTLQGKKLKGEWAIVRMHGQAGGGGKNWLLMKIKDSYADSNRDILDDSPQSVKSSRSLDQIASARDKVWSDDARETGERSNAIHSAFPKTFSPQLAVLAEHPPEGDNWLHEIKFDGYRLQARIKAGDVHLITRGGKDWTDKFTQIAKSLGRLKVDSAIVDGEAIVMDEMGRSDFQALQARMKNQSGAQPVLMAFDLPFCNGFDLRKTPLLERKAQLKGILDKSKLSPIVNFSEHIQGDGDQVIRNACRMNLEGIVSKQIDSPYVSRRETTWLKSKCSRRQEFVVIGFTPPQGSRRGFGSLLLGYHEAKGKLTYAGRVGTGFDDKLLGQTVKQLEMLEQSKAPTASPPPARERHNARWVKPVLVAEVRFTAWTRDGMLRHPVFIAFRTDKPAEQIVREKPVKVKGDKVSKAPRSKDVEPPEVEHQPDDIAGVKLSHPDKILFPDVKVTKRDVAEYYQVVSQWMLPHVINRPLALVRCPNGVGSKCFFQRNWTNTLPPAIDKINVGTGSHKDFHVMIHDLSGVIALAQMGVLEIHTWGCGANDVEKPDQLIFDLDPGPDMTWKRMIGAARKVREQLETLRLPAFLKTSGGKGLHIVIPIAPRIDWDSAKAFCSTLAHSMANSDKSFVANMRKDLRGGKIYIDYNRNGRTATAVAPYSTRARPGAAVAMPISWDQLGQLDSASHFTVETAGKYLKRRKSDPWRDFDKSRIDLQRALDRKSAA